MLRLLTSALTALLVAAGLFGVYYLLAQVPTRPWTDIAPGVAVSVEDLISDDEGAGGRLYLARIKLDPTLLDLYVTPPDPALTGTPFTHRLAHTATVARRNHLAVATNACLFASASPYLRRPGEPAHQSETTVVRGQIVSLWDASFMLGFDDRLAPIPGNTRPLDPKQISTYRWGIGSQIFLLYDPHVHYETEPLPHRRTLVGLDASREHLFLIVFTRSTFQRIKSELLSRGIKYAYNLDGSESSTFAVSGKAWSGDWRPVCNHIGVTLSPASLSSPPSPHNPSSAPAPN